MRLLSIKAINQLAWVVAKRIQDRSLNEPESNTGWVELWLDTWTYGLTVEWDLVEVMR